MNVPAYRKYQTMSIESRIHLYKNVKNILEEEFKRTPQVYEVILTLAALVCDNISDISELTKEIQRMKEEYELELSLQSLRRQNDR